MSYNSKYTGKQVEEILESVGGKQDRITDLTAIREGASKGATAIQNIKTLNNQSLLGSGNIDIPNSYITDFNVEILFGAIDNALANPGQHYSINSSADLLSAISAGKTIFIPYEQMCSGYICAINALNDGDTFYLTIAKENSLITLELDNEDLSHGTIYISDSVIYITKTSYVVTSFTMEDLYAMADVPSGSIPFTDIMSVQNAFSARRPVYVRASENEKLSMYPLTGHRDEDQWYFYVWRGDTLVTMESYDDANLEYITERHVPSEFKTINGESIIGEGDITIVGGGGDEPYITTCTVGDLQNLLYGTVDRIEFDSRGIAGALSENKRVLMPYNTTSSNGYYSVVGHSQGAFLYLTVVSNAEVYDIQTSLNYQDLYTENITRLVIPSENQIGNAAIHQLAFDFPVVYDVFEEGQYEVNSEDYGTFFDTADVGIIAEKIRTEGNVVVAVVDDHDVYQLLPATVWFDEQGTEFNILVYSPYSKYWYEILMNLQSGYQSIKRYKNYIEGSSSAYPQIDAGLDGDTFDIVPNTFYVFGEKTDLDITFIDAESSGNGGKACEYLFQFTSGSEGTTLVLNDDIKWASELVIEPNKIYQISILNGLGTVMSWDNSNLIAFSVLWGMSGTLNFECEKGMTWEAFVASSYNTDSALRIYNGNIWYGSYRIQDVTPTTIIENGKVYTSIYAD